MEVSQSLLLNQICSNVEFEAIQNNMELSEIFSLVQLILSKVCTFATKSLKYESDLTIANNKIEQLEKERCLLQKNNEELSKPCESCLKLKQYATYQKKKAVSVEQRLKSIAELLSVNKMENSPLPDTLAVLANTPTSDKTRATSPIDNDRIKRKVVSITSKRKQKNEKENSDDTKENTDLEQTNSTISGNQTSGQQETKTSEWSLKTDRELSAGRLKQTTLSLTKRDDKLDVTTLTNYNGGATTRQSSRSPLSERSDETFFDPMVTSTCNDVAPAKKQLSPQALNRSYDELTAIAESPPYKYRRDPVRKKADRRRLPGQECAKCYNFYRDKRDEMSDSQIRRLVNNCSRHRDKYPIVSNTPPGFWNPKFDTEDDSS